jgi:hypothetical protein
MSLAEILNRQSMAGPRRRLVVEVLLCTVVGTTIVLAGVNATIDSRRYVSSPQYKSYAFLITLVWAFLPVVWRVGCDTLDDLGTPARMVLRQRLPVAASGVLAVVVVAVVVVATVSGVYAPGDKSPLNLGIYRVGLTYAAASVALVPAVAAMWQCLPVLTRLRAIQSADLALIDGLLNVRRALLRSLTAAGSLVSLGVLATGAQRQAVLAYDPHANYPASYVVVWGLGFSAALLVNFIPGFRSLIDLANATVEVTFPLLPPGEQGWRDALDDRAALAGLLQVRGSARDIINSSILVAGPLMTSTLSLFLPSGNG